MLLALVVASCVATPVDRRSEPAPAAAMVAVAQWSSSADASRKLAAMPSLQLVPMAPAPDVVTVEPLRQYQAMVGFGAAMTDASADVIMGMPDAEAREALFDELFLPDRQGFAFMRLPIGASDFSREHYSFDDMPAGQADPGLVHFSMAQAAPQLAATRAAKARSPDMVLMATPWSAPGWMKTSDSLVTGRLSPGHYADFAAYLARYLAEMDRTGLPVDYLSIQNEPHFEPGDYPGMRMDPAARTAFVGGHLGPLLARQHPATKILDWDHNWNEPDSPLAVLADPAASSHIVGVAWHCYAGDVSAQGVVHDAFPEKDAFFTECSGGEWAPHWGETLGWMTANLVIGATRNWSRGTLLWNLALDENHGPHKGGCGDCRGVVTIDSRTGAVTRNVEYYVLGHASRFVRPGARRIASDEIGDIANVAWQNPDGGLVLLAFNHGTQAAVFKVRVGASGFSATMPAGEVTTFTWRSQG